MLSLNTVHRICALPILVFIAFHLFNHLVSIVGIEAHIAVMDKLRVVYRNPIIETILIVSLLAQISIGVYFVYRSSNKRLGFFQRAQAYSGLYMAIFVLAHVGAVLNGRYNIGLETNFYFAAAGMHIGHLKLFFIPYYLLAVVAVFTHVACATHWYVSQRAGIDRANLAGWVIMAIGALLAVLIVASLGGAFYEVSIPRDYEKMF